MRNSRYTLALYDLIKKNNFEIFWHMEGNNHIWAIVPSFIFVVKMFNSSVARVNDATRKWLGKTGKMLLCHTHTHNAQHNHVKTMANWNRCYTYVYNYVYVYCVMVVYRSVVPYFSRAYGELNQFTRSHKLDNGMEALWIWVCL